MTRPLHVAVKLVERLAHAVQTLVFEVGARAGEDLDGGKRVGVVGSKLRHDRFGLCKQSPRAGEIRRVGPGLARKDGIIGEPLFLRPLDLGVPIGPLHQAHGNAPVLAGGKITEPRDHGQRPFLIGLDRQPKAVPAPQRLGFAHHLKNVEHDVEALGFLGVDGEGDIGVAGLPRQFHERRQKLVHHPFVLDPFIARMQCGKFDGNARALENRCRLVGKLGGKHRERIFIGRVVARRVGRGVGSLAQHVEGEPVALRHIRPRLLQGFADVPPEHKLSAQDAHGIGDSLADNRLAGSREQLAPETGEVPFGSLLQCYDAAGEQKPVGGGINEQRVRPIEMALPVTAADLVADEAIGGGGVGHAQQRFCEAHQHHAFLAGKRIFLREGIDGFSQRVVVELGLAVVGEEEVEGADHAGDSVSGGG